MAYLLENDPAGNNIVSLRVATDGTLSDLHYTSTRGRRAFLVSTTNTPDTADTLGSQGSVTVVGKYLVYDFTSDSMDF